MGNSQPRYFNDKEALEIIGKHTAERLASQLNQNGRYLDYNLFCQIIAVQFDRMPKALCECLFHAFSSDLYGKVEIKSFISALAAIVGESADHLTQLKFLFRVYSSPNSFELERHRVEKILLLAYGNTLDKSHAFKELEMIFNGQTYLSQKDFELISHPLPVLSGWIRAVLTIYVEDLPPRLASLDRRYSAALESEQMMARYGVPKSTCDQLRQVYYAKCSSNGSTKGELTEEGWINWTCRFLPITLARIIYRSKLDPPLKTVWRFVDFAEYCMIFGRSTLEDMASTLCVAFQQQSHLLELIQRYKSDHASHETETEAMELEEENSSQHQEKRVRYTPLVSIVEMRRLLYLLSLPSARFDLQETSPSSSSVSAACPSSELPVSSTSSNDHLELQKLHLRYGEYLNPIVLRDLLAVEELHSDLSLQSYVDLICTNSSCLPGLIWLSITACCVFGLQPSSAIVEKEYITELMLWKETETLQSSKLPYGKLGTEWCIISSEWWLKWSYYVGRSNSDEPPPPPIDNWFLLKKSSSAKQLLPNLTLGTDFEIINPEVFQAFQAWYGGGPKIIRKVIPSLPSTSSSSGSSSVSSSGSSSSLPTQQQPQGLPDTKPMIEFYPICIRLSFCDENGKLAEHPLTFEQLWSKFAKIGEILAEICLTRGGAGTGAGAGAGTGTGGSEIDKLHLWNVENKNWKKHFILTPDLTLAQAGVVDGQLLLIERQLNNGMWPKAQLHSQLEADESRPSSDSPLPSKSNQLVTSPTSPTSPSSIHINNGRVGLDNLGNTCYMNSSLQALLHTNFLNEYFLTKLYLRDLNKTNRHGYGGRLAAAYCSLVNDLWCSKQSDQLMGHAIAVMTDAMNAVTTSPTSGSGNSRAQQGSEGVNGFAIGPSSVNPRKFRKEVGALREQFAGDDQHDAQELLSFLLDGLSEDLNLVQTKPYIEQPDSDDRPDQVLADIWWENHLKRDISAIQSIFTGQFKSITTCKNLNCDYNSARYEPFNMLSVPLPEDSHRSLITYVFTLTSQFLTCSVRVPKIGTLKDVVEILKSYGDLEGVREDSLFIPVHLSNFRVLNILTLLKPIDSVRDSDFIVFYQVKEIPVTRSLPTVVTGAAAAPLVGATGRYGSGRTIPSLRIDQSQTKGSTERGVTSPSPASPPSQSEPSESPECPEMERETSYDGDSDSGEDLKEGEAREGGEGEGEENKTREVGPMEQIPLGEDFMRGDVEGEITGAGAGAGNGISGSSPLSNDQTNRQDTIEAVFIHRRVKFTSVGGIEMFKMEQIGLPLLEVLPVRVSAVEVYSLISKRVSVHLKSSISDLAKSNLLSANVVGSPLPNNSLGRHKKNSVSSPQLQSLSPKHSNSDQLPRSHSNLSIRSESLAPSRIRPVATQDAIGGDIPPHGFVLRLPCPRSLPSLSAHWFTSSTSSALFSAPTLTAASDMSFPLEKPAQVADDFSHCRCHWLSRCEGCVIPYDDDETMLTLDDGITIAIDWHYVVYQEILDLRKALEVIQHPSMGDHQSFQSKELPLEKCLQKFTEEEPLDDMVCPKCREDKCLKRSFAIWRLPPVLIIQLKRFQFNNYSRRKLTNFVNFPVEDLDMTQFLAPSARALYQTVDSSSLPNETSDAADETSGPKMGTLYDLYSAVYHVGALGGGHYITTVRDMSDHLAKVLSSSSAPGEPCSPTPGPVPSSPSRAGASTVPGASPVKWWCYNDSTVTPMSSDKDIVVSSAYVLFYLRKDLQHSRFQDIHQIPSSLQQTADLSTPSATSASDNEQEEKPTATTRMTEAKNKLSRLIPPNMTAAVGRGGGGEEESQMENQDNCHVS